MVNRWDLSLYWPWTPSHYLKCFNTHASVNAKIIESLLFHFISLSPSFSFTSATLQRQHRSRNSDQNSLNSWLLQTMPGLPDSSLEVEFRALCAKRKPPFSFFFIPRTNVKATFRGRSNQGHVHNAGRTSRGLRLSSALNCEVWKRIQRELFSSDWSHIHINMISNGRGWRSNSTTILCTSAPFSV